MKIFTLSFLLVFACTLAMAQDSISNPGFEHWSQGGGFTDPDNWQCANPFTSVIGTITCRQDSAIVHSGRYSCNLVTKYVAQISSNIPGVLTTGVIPTSPTASISGGALIHSRPMSVSGWFQYVPGGADTGGITISLIRGDSVIGSGGFNFADTVKTWTPFSFNITYVSNSIPDTSQIIVVSSNGSGTINSSLWVDDLAYSYYPASIKETERKVIGVYPNPANNQFMINNIEIHATTLNLYSVDGKLVKGYKLQEGVNTLSLSGIGAGVYMIRATDNTGATYTNSLIVDK